MLSVLQRLSIIVVLSAACVPLCPSASAQASKRVLMIGIDGAGGQYIPDADVPNLDALASGGAARYDFNNEGALTPNPPEAFGASGVNWSTILTGASAANHQVVDNSFAGSDFTNNPHFFQFVKAFDSSLSTASITNWSPLNSEIPVAPYADLLLGLPSAKIGDEQVKNETVSLLETGDPDVLFLHFDQVDGAGHANSWGSPAYYAAIETVDGLIGEIMTALNARPGVVSGQEDWLVLVTADHGGGRGSHSHLASQGPENWEVPYIVSGPSVEDGAAMQRGTLRDLAPTALWHLGIDPFLAGMDGTVRGLAVAPPSGVEGDINNDGVLSGNGAGPAATDDVRAFLNNWLATGEGGIPDRYSRGDVNLDGITDLADWAILNRLDPAMGAAIAQGLHGSAPEPAAGALALLCLLASARVRSRENNA